MNKKRYVLHYRNLQLYLSLGLKLTKIHRCIEFTQKPWLKEYIDFNTQKRKESKNDFEKNFFKLMNNSVFGKTMENIRKRSNIRLVTGSKALSKLTSRPTFKSFKIFNEDLIAVDSIKEKLTLDKPIYVGMSILEISKTLMYDFHYNFVKKTYDDKAKLLFTDTDSLCYDITTSTDCYDTFLENRDLFDNSGYNPSSKHFFGENKKVIGKMKDELNGVPIIEFVGLKSKMYAYRTEDEESKRAKGTNRSVVAREIHFNNYKEILLGGEIMRSENRVLRSKSHVIKSQKIDKISLSCYDDKRYILDDGIKTLAYGHR